MSPTYIDTYYSRTVATSETYPTATGRIQADVCVSRRRARRSHGGAEARPQRAQGRFPRGAAWLGVLQGATAASSLRLCDRPIVDRAAGRQGPQAKELFCLSMEGVEISVGTIDELGIDDANLVPSTAKAVRYNPRVPCRPPVRPSSASSIEPALSSPETVARSLFVSTKYREATLDEDAFHFHPLNYGRALAREAPRLGARSMRTFSPRSPPIWTALKRLSARRKLEIE